MKRFELSDNGMTECESGPWVLRAQVVQLPANPTPTDHELMELIANSAQTLHERGYDVEVTPRPANPMLGIEARTIVTVSRTVWSGEDNEG